MFALRVYFKGKKKTCTSLSSNKKLRTENARKDMAKPEVYVDYWSKEPMLFAVLLVG